MYASGHCNFRNEKGSNLYQKIELQDFFCKLRTNLVYYITLLTEYIFERKCTASSHTPPTASHLFHDSFPLSTFQPSGSSISVPCILVFFNAFMLSLPMKSKPHCVKKVSSLTSKSVLSPSLTTSDLVPAGFLPSSLLAQKDYRPAAVDKSVNPETAWQLSSLAMIHT